MQPDSLALNPCYRLRRSVQEYFRLVGITSSDAFQVALIISLTTPGTLLELHGRLAYSPADASPASIFDLQLFKDNEVTTLAELVNFNRTSHRTHFARFIRDGARQYANDALTRAGWGLQNIDLSRGLADATQANIVQNALRVAYENARAAALPAGSRLAGAANGTLGFYMDETNSSTPYYKYNWRQAAFVLLIGDLQKALNNWNAASGSPNVSTQLRPPQDGTSPTTLDTDCISSHDGAASSEV
ncbi:hypothetical protein Vretimale_16848 [Volvox reticuliferus]|uniref:Uncharacterized protein n=1 Tax=Volvox reticuliferus TaxID=1737510 RepID=A0A8J4FVH7_9CHLO|nr:hypothetical protein Vretifemale_18504 [Volvox reticuliferus]GIM13784.1 hypothetical protein Vretimale_16848 [Volvox reticuliferus]